MTREEQIYNAMGDAESKHVDGTKDIELFDMGFKEGAQWADSHPRWIRVEDELPPKESEYEDNSIVVLATDGYGVYKGIYRCGEYYSGWFTCDLWALENITHWMPLPQAPHHFIDANKKVDRVIGTADHIKTALDVLNKKGGE